MSTVWLSESVCDRALDMVADASRSARTSGSASPPGTWMAGLGRNFACWAPLILLRVAAAIMVSAATWLVLVLKILK